MPRKYEQIEERMLAEYVHKYLRDRPHWIHLRLGMPPGVSRDQPGWEYERRIKMPRLPEVDLCYIDDDGNAVLVEFKVRRFQDAVGKLLFYKKLLPETPGFFDWPEDKIRMKIVFGRKDPVAEEFARSMGIETEFFQPEWLREALIKRAGRPTP